MRSTLHPTLRPGLPPMSCPTSRPKLRAMLAANLSPALIEALRRDPPLVDAVKASEFGDPQYVAECRRLASSKPFVVHGICQRSDWGRLTPPPAGNPGFRESIDVQAVRTALEVAKPEYVSVHLERPAHASSSTLLMPR